ncbi:hypothetical protein GCM10027299_28180 [Larkinella ripae]
MAYTCFIIGKDTLLIECAGILQQNGFQIKGIISSDRQVRQFCADQAIPFLEMTGPFASVLEENPFDYLFSIVNSYILPASVLRLPRLQTINYHDSPLPAYAGVHATFWALIQGERTHGITWHGVDAGIDTGPILSQRRFAVEPDETSIQLNINCYAAGIAAFRELVAALRSDTLASLPQNPAQRTYFGLNKRPNTFIDWQRSATQLARLYRALDFGFHPNPFGLLKVRVGHDVFLVKEAGQWPDSPEHPDPPAGTIVCFEPDLLAVATGEGVLGLRALVTQTGEAVSLSALRLQSGLQEGQLISPPEPAFWHHYQQWDRQCAPFQRYWTEKLSRFSPTSVSIHPSADVDENLKQAIEYRPIIPTPTVDRALAPLPEADQADLLLCAFLVAVARMGSQASVGVGYSSPTSRQIAAETAGLFWDCLPFTVDFDWESNAEKAISALRQERAAVEKHCSFARDWLLTQPALQSVAQLVNEHHFPIVIHRMVEETDRPVPRQGLILILSDAGTCQLAYDLAVWQASQVNELINRWLIVLENLVSHPSTALKTVPLLTPEEQQRILIDWNATAVPYPRDQTVAELVEAQVTKSPQAVALRCGPVSLTYEQVNQQANQLAHYLRERGVTTNTLVGLCLERSPEMLVSLLAILKAGGAYVPLDPDYPASRLQELCAQTGIQWIVTKLKWRDRLPAEGITPVFLDQETASWAGEKTGNLDLPRDGNQLAYVVFTSGSTGQPKSVAIPHRGVARLVKGANYAQLDETTILLGMAPLAFDASTFDVWATLANGGQLILMPERQPTLDAIKYAIQAHRVNTVFLTTALFNVLVDSDLSGLTTLSQLLTGGEAASVSHLHRAQQQLPACKISNVYGPTESTTFATFYPLPSTAWDAHTVPIGRPLSNTRLYIVDSFTNPVPVGVVGELLIGGDGLARDYLFQPELTREKFIADPFSQDTDGRLYRTGDQARYRADGAIEFIGRLDDQVKIRGFRIEPGEVEFALGQHPAVKETFVVVAETPSGQKELVAYLVPQPHARVVPDDVRAFLQTRLPQHLIPAALVPLESLPLTANGKVAKNGLPPAFPRSQAGGDEVLTATEQVLLPLWKALLNYPDLSREDDFFETGGNSLLAMQLVARIQRQFGRPLSVKDVFEHPTLRRLSARLDQNPETSLTFPAAQKPASEHEPGRGGPLSFAQNRLWIIHQLHDLRGTYNVQVILKIRGPLNLLALQQSLEEVVRRHQVLRTTFGHSNGIPFQQLVSDFSLPFEVTELNDRKEGAERDWSHWLQTEAYRPFKLEDGPLMRFRVAHRGPDSWVLMLVFHHLIYDGWSSRVLARELSQLYTSFVRHQPVSLPPLPIQYADYARWQLEQFTPSALQRDLTYWKNRLTGAPSSVNLPIDKPRPAAQSFEGADYTFPIADGCWQQIQTGVHEPGTTVFLRLLTAFSVWLSRVTQSADLVVGIPIAGRSRADVVDSIGFFVNTLALRITVSGDWTFRQLLQQVRQWTLEAYDHQDLPFEQVVEGLRLPRTLAYAPLVQVMFDFHEDQTKDWQLDELVVDTLLLDQQVAKFDLHVSFRETNGGVNVTFNYRPDLFSATAIVQMADDFVAVLKALVAHPDQPILNVLGLDQIQPTLPALNRDASEIEANSLDELWAPQSVDAPLIDWLQTTWCWLLEVPSLGLDDDFFEMGGHSLLAFQMIAELQKKIGRTLPVGSVFANPTIRKLAAYLKTRHADLVWESLVAVKPQGRRAPLYLVHPVSGDVGYAYQLAPYLPDDQPVFALRAVGLDGIGTPFTTIEAMAAYYVKLILEKQPDGPYALGGYSLGGIVAYEMARQLKQRGKEVSLLAIIDSYPVSPTRSHSHPIPMGRLLHYYYDVWRSLPKQPGFIMRTIRNKAPFVRGYLINRLQQSFRRYPPSTHSVQTGAAQPETAIVTINQMAYSAYVFQPYDGKMVFLRAVGQNTGSRTTVTFGWNRYARRGVEVYPLPGDHYSLFKHEATISNIAGILTAHLPI